MKFATIALLGSMAGSAVAATGMAELMAKKTAQRTAQREAGLFDKDRMPPAARKAAVTKCVNGKAGVYSCSNVDLYGFLSHQVLGSTTREGNDVWGWTSSTGREFGIVGQTDGSAFVEVLKDGSLVYKGRLATQTVTSIWRDMKVIGDFVYIGAESSGHGLQVFDLKKLLPLTSPKVFNPKTDLTAWFRGFGSSHNIVAHAEKNMIYAVGTQNRDAPGCNGGLFMVDVTNPAKPVSPGCAGKDGYVHDAQCVVYNGPDGAYKGKEICFGYNEDTLTIYDVTNKKAPVVISRTPYTGASYTHQGWLATDDHRFLLLDDELDEDEGNGPAANGRTTTYIWDISTLADPVNTGYYQSPAKAIDHNQYVLNGLSYQSNYGSGLRIRDVRSVAADPTGGRTAEAGFFDVHPEDDANGGNVEFVGSWSVYPYFKSGYLLLNSIERGIYSLKYTGA